MSTTTTCMMGALHAKALFENSKLAHSLISYNAFNYQLIPTKLAQIKHQVIVEKIVLFISPLTHRGRKQRNTYVFDPLNVDQVTGQIQWIIDQCKKVTSNIIIVEGPPRGQSYLNHSWQKKYNQICYFLQHVSEIKMIKWYQSVQNMCQLPVGTRHVIESPGFQQYFQDKFMPDKVHCTHQVYKIWGNELCKLCPQDAWVVDDVSPVGPLLL